MRGELPPSFDTAGANQRINWVRAGRELGTRWATHNIAAVHNRLLAPEMSAWSFNEALANGTAEVRLSL